MVMPMHERVELVEKLKPILLEWDWAAVSIYKSEDRIYVYKDGELVLEMPTTPATAEENLEEEVTD